MHFIFTVIANFAVNAKCVFDHFDYFKHQNDKFCARFARISSTFLNLNCKMCVFPSSISDWRPWRDVMVLAEGVNISISTHNLCPPHHWRWIDAPGNNPCVTISIQQYFKSMKIRNVFVIDSRRTIHLVYI